MKPKKRIIFFRFVAGCLFFILQTGVSTAGQIWIVPSKFQVNKGGLIDLSLGQGVLLGRSYELISKINLEFIHHRSDRGKIPLPLEPGALVYKTELRLKEPGTHIFTAAAEGIRLVKTGRGWRLERDKHKKTLGRSLFLNKFTKTFIRVGKRGSDFKKIIGGKLEIVPLKDPGSLRVGDRLKVRVLFDGEGVEMLPVKATYLGYGGREDQVPVNKITDLMGQTDIELTEAGPWFVYTYKVIQGKKVSRGRDRDIFESSLVFYVNK